VIAVASEPGKAQAVLGALRTGIVDSLVATVEIGSRVVGG
jgi:DNA-binding transcriptional regulator LsrR (DeoR family)